MNTSGMSRINEAAGGRESGQTQNASQAAGSRNAPVPGMNDTRLSQLTAGSGGGSTQAAKRAAAAALEERARLEKLEQEARLTRGGLDNLSTLLNEVFLESDVKTPVLFIVTSSVNVGDIISDFHQKKQSSLGGLRLQQFALSAGLESMVASRLEQAAQNGDWILLENLHLVPDWLPTLQALILSTATGPDVNSRFRVFTTAIPDERFPKSILEKFIKVALQPPKSMKQKISKMLLDQEQDGFFRKSGRHANVHKNLFVGLAYFHAILGSRARFGNLGWNLPQKFEETDFEMSNLQLSDIMKSTTNDLMATLQKLRYFFC